MLTQIEREKSESDFHTKANVCSYQTLHMVDLIQILVRHQWQVTKSLHTQKAISQCTTTTHRTTSKKQRHNDLPHLPAFSGFTCKGECNCCTIHRVIAHDLRNTAMHFLNVKLIIPLFHWLFFCRLLTSAFVTKRLFFLVNTCSFFLGRCIGSMPTDPSYPPIFFCQCLPSIHHVLAWLRMRGGRRGAMVMLFQRKVS